MLCFLFLSVGLSLLSSIESVASFKLTPEEKKLIQAYRLRHASKRKSSSSLKSLSPIRNEEHLEWVMSENLTKWYTRFDLCMLNYTSSNVTIEEMTNNCSASIYDFSFVIHRFGCL